MEDLSEFRAAFLADASAWASADGNFKRSAFIERAAEFLIESEEITEFEPCYFRGTGARGRILEIDGYSFDEADGAMRLFLADYRESDVPDTLERSQAKTYFDRMKSFFEESIDGRLSINIEESDAAYNLADLIKTIKGSITRIRFYLISDAMLSTRVNDWPEGEIAEIPVEHHIWDMSRFYRVASSRSGRDELIVDFTEFYPNGIPCLPASVCTDEYSAYLCILPGHVLADVYDRFGSRLLEGNVRSFLNFRSKINKGIRKTIATEPQMFFAFNNGIATTATDVKVDKGSDGMHLLLANDFQIVNGGQTTASMTSSRRRDKLDLSRTFVQMKLVVIAAERSGTVIPQISRFANSQNKVSDADFFSNHEFHRRVEELSRRILAPAVGGKQSETYWFYERARGQYLNEMINLTTAQAKRHQILNPRRQLITKTDLAKYENSWRQLPYKVSLGAQKNFLIFAEYISEAWNNNDLQFNDVYFKDIVARAILFRTTEKIVSSQDWYNGGYRAQTVAYAISHLAHMIETQAPEGMILDFSIIWQAQDLSSALLQQLESITKAVYKVITEANEGISNVGEWCKKELCWARVKSIELKLSNELKRELIDKDDASARQSAAKRRQKVEVGISEQITVCNLGSAYWNEMLKWALSKSLVDRNAEDILRKAASIPQKLPNEKECAVLMRLKERLESEGFGWLNG